MTLEERFTDAQQRVQKLPQTPPPGVLLKLYALYKQSTVGDVQGKRPSMLDIRGRAKYDAWTERKGLSKDEAMTAYVQFVDELTGA